MNQRMYDELIDLITTNSSSGNETLFANKVISKMEALGFAVRQDNAGDTFGGTCGNVIAFKEGVLPGSILFSCHMDRVPNGLDIHPVEKDGILYSNHETILAADDVSGVSAIIEGIRQLLESGKEYPRIEIVFSVGEETGLFGAKALDYSQLQSKLCYVIDSPGRFGRVVNGAPGHYKLQAEVFGKPAHAGNEPEKGINAAKILCDIVSGLKQGRIDEITTSNFSVLSTGSKSTNVVCDYAMVQGEVRSRNAQRLQDYLDYFESFCKETVEKQGASVKVTKTCTFEPFLIDEDDISIRIAKKALSSLHTQINIETGGGGMDANIFNQNGITSIGIASGYSKNHTKDEQLVLSDCFQTAELIRALIETYSQMNKGGNF